MSYKRIIRTVGRKYTGADLADIVILAGSSSELITLDRLATIHDGFTEDPINAVIEGVPAVFVMVFKTTEEDALHISNTVSDY